MIFGWVIQSIFAVANIALMSGIFMLRNQNNIPVAQADFELFLLAGTVGGMSIASSILSLVIGALTNLKNPDFSLRYLYKRPFGLICLFNVLIPVLSYLVFPRG
jgi:hypothetical protein